MFFALLLLAAAIAACGGGETVTETVEEAAEVVEETVDEAVEAVDEAVEEVMAELECSDPLGCVEVDADDPVTIAYMLTTSGATAFLGEDSLGGIEIAISDRGGEILGHEIELAGEDSLCSAEGGQSAVARAVREMNCLRNNRDARLASCPDFSYDHVTVAGPPRLDLVGHDIAGHHLC